MTRKIDFPLILLAIAGFLAPLIGGKVAVDTMPIAPGSDPILSAFLGASETPTLSHAILAALCSGALIIMLLQRKIMQVPNSAVGGLLVVLLALIVSTIGISSYRGVSIPAGMEWVTYGICFYAVVAAGGRQRGPAVILGAIFAGCVVLALLGFQDYGENKIDDPTYRIFPQWIGPNAMAAELVVGFFAGLGLSINAKRPVNIAIAVGCVEIGLALFLTQSKGSLLALAVSLIVYAVLLIVWLPRRELPRAAGLVAGTVATVVLLSAAISFQPKTSSGGASLGPGARLVSAGSSAEQSVEFRKLLWESAIKITERNPLGIGIGTFQFESARPGLVTQTHFAHEAYLQLAAESSFIAPVLLLAALAFWARLVFRGGSKLMNSQNVLRASVFAALLSVVGHSLVDSDFSYYGVGLAAFMLLGIGLLLSSDAVAPEFLPATFRRAAAGGIGVLTLLLIFLGYVEGARAQASGSLATKSLNDAASSLESLRSIAPWDAEVWHLSTLASQDPAQRLEFARRTVQLAPSTRNLRTLAKLEVGKSQSDALGDIQRALDLDPNNLQTLTLLADIQRQVGEDEKAMQTLRRLVEVEKTGYFKIRSLPESIPTETYLARCTIAESTTDPKSKIDLLQPAVNGFRQYLTITVPNVLRFAKSSGGALPYAGETLETSKAKLAKAAIAAKSLAEAYRAGGDTAKAGAADEDAAAFAKPLDLPSDK